MTEKINSRFVKKMDRRLKANRADLSAFEKALDDWAHDMLKKNEKTINRDSLEDMDFDEFYPEIGRRIGALVAEKQAAYGDSFGKAGAVMEILYPDGVPKEKMGDMLTVVRIIDKLFRIATDRDAMGESPWRDIAGYAILAHSRAEESDE